MGSKFLQNPASHSTMGGFPSALQDIRHLNFAVEREHQLHQTTKSTSIDAFKALIFFLKGHSPANLILHSFEFTFLTHRKLLETTKMMNSSLEMTSLHLPDSHSNSLTQLEDAQEQAPEEEEEPLSSPTSPPPSPRSPSPPSEYSFSSSDTDSCYDEKDPFSSYSSYISPANDTPYYEIPSPSNYDYAPANCPEGRHTRTPWCDHTCDHSPSAPFWRSPIDDDDDDDDDEDCEVKDIFEKGVLVLPSTVRKVFWQQAQWNRYKFERTTRRKDAGKKRKRREEMREERMRRIQKKTLIWEMSKVYKRSLLGWGEWEGISS